MLQGFWQKGKTDVARYSRKILERLEREITGHVDAIEDLLSQAREVDDAESTSEKMLMQNCKWLADYYSRLLNRFSSINGTLQKRTTRAIESCYDNERAMHSGRI